MGVATDRCGVNEEYQPDEREEAVLDVLREYKTVNPLLVRRVTELRKQYVNAALDGLTAAGWVERVTVDGDPIRGLYRYVGDPRVGE